MIGVKATTECTGTSSQHQHQRTGVSSSNYPSQNHHMQSSSRERTMHAVEYYNNNVLKARVGAGLAGPRSSVNERHLSYGGRPLNSIGTRLYQAPTENIYRSNSSLELLDPTNETSPGGPLRREYGSHGSIDVISSDRSPVATSTSESFFAMLQEYRPAVLGMNNNNNNNNSKKEPTIQEPPQNYRNSSLITEDNVDRGNSSPKLRMKLKLWGQTTKTQRSQSHIPTIEDGNTSNSTTTATTTVASADIEERTKRRAFAHYDCQSLTANLGYAAKLRGLLLARRRNTTTGASAAAMFTTRSSTPDGDSADEDFGDGLSNDLTESCPFFRNEVGGEEEREVSLTRMASTAKRPQIHRPSLAYGVSVLECPPFENLWSNKNTCPYQKNSRPIEQVDNGAHYYRKYFYGQEHQNWFGMDEQLGPIAISIKKEKPAIQPMNHSDPSHQQQLFRLIVRTSELLTLRGSVFEDSIPNPRGAGKLINTKEVLEYVAPEVQIGSLRLAMNTPQCETQLLKLDEQGLTNNYKIGVLYCRAGQSTEEEMYNNEEAGPAFTEFLDTIGKKVRLKGFENYKAGLDNKTDSTGTHSVYATYQDCEIMFHVSTMLPFTPNNRQQLLRKRHIGNDIVTIVFQEPGALPFTPKHIRSQFQHVFVIVRAVNPCSENTYYRVAVSRSKEVPVFGPPIRLNALYQKGKHFAEFLLAKVINAENAAHRSEKFATMATRTRQEYLKDLCTNYCTQTPVETGQKFSIFPMKKKEPTKPRFSGDSGQRGAFCWQVVLHDSGLASQVDCFLGISAETFVLIEESSRQTVFCVPNRSILGWSTNGNALRVYHHQGECITMGMRDNLESGDEQLEVIERLRNVTNGCGALELSLKRNSVGQLGFHVQPDGVVTQVEINGQAWVAGLRQGYRLVEICKVAVATLSHDQMVDLLKTSVQVTVTVIESHPDHSHRRGCFVANCKFNAINYDDDYELVDGKKLLKKTPAQTQAQTVNNQKRYDRNFSPPRSSNSSGYGTGSSSRSFTAAERFVPDMGTLTSSSSGHSSNDERWYDVVENQDASKNEQHPKLATTTSLPLSQIHEARPIPRQANIEYLSNRQSKVVPDYVSPETLMKNFQISEDKNNNRSEPIYSVSLKNVNQQSLDELSKVPSMELAQLKRSATTNNIQSAKKTPTAAVAPTSSSSSTSSRNNSPRPLAEAKLRSGINNRTNANHRASVHYSSTLQEDLLKLINPDYLMGSSDDNFHQGGLSNQISKQQKNSPNSHSLGNLSTTFQASPLKTATAIIADDLILAKKKSRSRENINVASLAPSNGQQQSNLRVHKSNGASPDDEIITTARPVNVISSGNSSPGIELIQNSKLLHISEEKMKMSPRKQLNGGGMMKNKFPVLNDFKEVEWNNLVDSATRAMLQVGDKIRKLL
jgi:signal-induced proliferation-associated 1 like protein 1